MGFVAPALTLHVHHGGKLQARRILGGPRGGRFSHLTEKIISQLVTCPVKVNRGQPVTAISFTFCSKMKGIGRHQVKSSTCFPLKRNPSIR